jgi:DNA-binding NarL/FixJ family response regulator
VHHAPKDQSAGQAATLRVFIVDADSRVRRGLRALLESDPFIAVVGEADRCEQVAVSAAGAGANVVLFELSDHNLHDGLPLIGCLSASLPVVVLSLRGSLRTQALTAGAAVFVETDAAADTLLSALQRAAAGVRERTFRTL